jgi:hypothetical protein
MPTPPRRLKFFGETAARFAAKERPKRRGALNEKVFK